MRQNSFNYLNNLFLCKLSFYKLIYELKQEEFLFYYDYIKRKGTGIWKIKNESKKNFYVIMITLQKEKFRNLESKKLKKKKKKN